MLERIHIAPNHKKWSEVTKVALKEKGADHVLENPILLGVYDGKNKRTVKMDKNSNPDITEDCNAFKLEVKSKNYENSI